MKFPPLLLGITLLFWGWQTGFWITAIPLAIIYEGSRYINLRWNLTTADFRQTSHICTVLLVGVLVYLLLNDRSLQLIFSFFQWLPLMCSPLLVAQAYSTSDRVELQALLFFKDRPKQTQPFALDLTYPYFAICILAASAANTRELHFYLGMVILINLVLNSIRSKRYSYLVFLALLLLATFLGTLGHLGIHRLQRVMSQNTARFFYSFYRPQTDPNQVSTAIGDIGSVKQSNQIVLRVKPAPGEVVPQLLRRATYNRYTSGFWVTSKAELKPVKPGKDEQAWELYPHSSEAKQVTISENLDDGQGLLKLPDSSFQITQLPVDEIQQNQYGTVQILGEPGLLSYQVQYDPNLSKDDLPIAEDLQITQVEQPAIRRIITELDLANKTPQEVLNTVNQFFNTEFSYSLELARQGNHKTSLSAFLLRHRSGHCEYFATATTLLLRGVGIPTRYAVGYSVHELSNLEQQYIVRSRHAHAWTQVYINGKWQAFDTTPSSWIAIEDKNVSAWQYLQDLWSLLWFKFSQLLTIIKSMSKFKYLWLLTLPLGWILIRQFIRQGTRKHLTAVRIKQQDTVNLAIGADSEIYLIEQKLNQLGLKRDRSETWQDWGVRLQNTPEISDLVKNLEPIIKLHYRYCFDPQGISLQEREELRTVCQAWLQQYANEYANSE